MLTTIGNEQFGDARELLNELETLVGENDADVIHARTLLEFMEDEG